MESASTRKRLMEVVATLVVIVGGGALTLALTEGSAGSGSGSPETAPSGPAKKADKITIADFKYDPPAIQATAGTEIAITNSDAAAHTITADDQSFDSGTVSGGEDGTVTIDEPGEYSYFCQFHPFMKGTVKVK